jgi:glycosyltransferase involved in cell wall biosynthesis
MKHNPALLVELASKFQAFPNVRVVVITEGLGADFLRVRKERLNLENLLLLPFQPFEEFPMALGAADVLVAVLEPDAGVFAVPSKVLTYLCTRRPLLLAVPPENLAARIVERAGAGFVIPPTDTAAFLNAAETLANDAGLREDLAANGLSYALTTFDIERITDQFVGIFQC